MTSQEIRLLAIRLFGLYQGAAAARILSQVIAFLYSSDSGIFALFTSYASWTTSVCVHGAACYICLAHTEKIANWVFADLLAPESAPEKRQRPFSMAFFIAILALYFIVSSAGNAMTGFTAYILTPSDNSLLPLWGHGFTFVLGILLLIGATLTERIITGHAPQLETVDGANADPKDSYDD